MSRLLPWFVLPACLSLFEQVGGVEVVSPSAVEKVVNFASPEFRRIEKRLDEIRTELKDLPAVRREAWGSRHGHRSASLATQTTRDWIQLDMKETRRVDTLALVPANLALMGQGAAGYGFPKRFRIEIADNPEMENAITLVDRSKKDVINPGLIPMVMEVNPAEGRYLRFTSLKHAQDGGDRFWAMEEFIALEGNLNVARSAGYTYSSSHDLFPLWAPVRLIDGQHGLGMPVDVTQASPSLGYLSSTTPYQTELDGLLPDDEQHWCMVDLGSSQTIEQLRILPIESDEYQVYGGRGFPRAYEMQLSNDPDFEEIV